MVAPTIPDAESIHKMGSGGVKPLPNTVYIDLRVRVVRASVWAACLSSLSVARFASPAVP